MPKKKIKKVRIEARVPEDVKAALMAEASRRGLRHRDEGNITALLTVLAHGFNPELKDKYGSDEFSGEVSLK